MAYILPLKYIERIQALNWNYKEDSDKQYSLKRRLF